MGQFADSSFNYGRYFEEDFIRFDLIAQEICSSIESAVSQYKWTLEMAVEEVDKFMKYSPFVNNSVFSLIVTSALKIQILLCDVILKIKD